MMKGFITELESIIEQRRNADPRQSYTAKLFEGGLDRILKKIGEEAGEVIIAGKNQDTVELRNEAADLVFHLLILLKYRNLQFQDIIDTLYERHQIEKE